MQQRDLPQILKEYPSVKYTLEGEQKEQNESLGSIFKNFFLAMIVVYTLLAIPFRSYLQPLIVMGAIPFGLTGAVIGHIIMGQNLTILSLIGIVALAGVVVNDALVLVDFIQTPGDFLLSKCLAIRSERRTVSPCIISGGIDSFTFRKSIFCFELLFFFVRS